MNIEWTPETEKSQYELNQTKLIHLNQDRHYQTNNINMVKITLT